MKKSELRKYIRKLIKETHQLGHHSMLGPKMMHKPSITNPKMMHTPSKEGKMAKYDAVEIASDASDVAEMIQDCTNLPEWVEAKITLAADYMNTVKDYLTHHMQLQEKKIGFNRGPEYSEETEDLLNDFAKSTEMINKELANKVVDSDDPKVQEILNILDDNLDSEFIDNLEAVYNLIQELPDKPKETPKIGFRE